MNAEMHQKVNANRLKRDAYLYVRQSTLRQVFENTESTKRQYAKRLGEDLPSLRVIVHDQRSDACQISNQPFVFVF